MLDGPGSLAPAVRLALASGSGMPEELRYFATTVREHAHQFSGGHVVALFATGYRPDQVFEAAVSAALGAGLQRLDAGIAALTESLATTPELPAAPGSPAAPPSAHEPSAWPASDPVWPASAPARPASDPAWPAAVGTATVEPLLPAPAFIEHEPRFEPTTVIDPAAPPLVRRRPGTNIPGHSQ